jgi:phenylacetate-CoA ligase
VASFARPYNWAGKKISPTRRVKMASVASGLSWHLSARVRSTLPNWWTPSLSMAASDPLDSITQCLNDWQPEVMMAFASMMRILADEQCAGRLHVAPHTMFSISEVLTEETRRRVKAAFGLDLFNQYGVTECGCLGAECTAHQGLHLAEDMVIVEAVDRNNQPVYPGQYSEKLLITSLFSYTQPLIRYELGDSVQMRQELCSCGRPYTLVSDIQGKVQETLYFPAVTGTKEIPLHPTVFKRVMDNIPATGWQIIQDRDALNVLMAGLPDSFDERVLAENLCRALTNQGVVVPPLQIERVSVIPRNPSGKAPLIKSNTRSTN